MVDPILARNWTRRLLFAALALTILFFQMLPLNMSAARWAGPDVLIAMALAWSVRRPAYVPLVLLASLMLLADFLTQRPPGVLAATTVMACEVFRRHARRFRDATFIQEWGAAAVLIVAILIVERTILFFMVVPRAPLGLSVVQVMMTIAVYPLVVAVTHFLLRVQKPTAAEMNSLRGAA